MTRVGLSGRTGVLVGLLAVIAVGFAAGWAAHPAAGGTRLAGGTAAADTTRDGPTREGAVAAASRYATALPGLLAMSEADARAVVTEMTTDAGRVAALASLESRVAVLRDELVRAPGEAMVRQQVLATRLEAYTDSEATVAVWTAQVAGVDRSDEPTVPQATFTTVYVVVQWERDAWRLASSRSTPGPTPALVGAPTDTAVFVATLDGFADWRPA